MCEPAEYSSALTAVMMPPGHDADALRNAILEHFDMSLGMGLAKLQGKVFRIGHLGDFNDLTLAGHAFRRRDGARDRRRAAPQDWRGGGARLPR